MGATVDSKSGTKAKKTKAKRQKLTENGKAAGSGTVVTAPTFENPLVPNAVLRQMYQKMVETRLLGEFAVQRGRKAKRGLAVESIHGQEACRVSVAQGLGDGDMVLDSHPGGPMAHLLGAQLQEVLQGFGTGARGAKGRKTSASTQSSATGLLPFVEEAEERLFAGLGAALLLKRWKRTDGVVIYVEHREATDGVWRRALKLAAAQDLPVIFVVLPKTKDGKTKGGAEVSGIAQRCGVPGIAVDASDVVALYRVTQESMGRIRGGGGPVLIEGVPYRVQGRPKPAGADPVAQMRGSLLERQVATEGWMAGIGREFRSQLAAARAG
jgi:TPP-dependent pyruvate/acetoin dehydrogenase alpha subunit